MTRSTLMHPRLFVPLTIAAAALTACTSDEGPFPRIWQCTCTVMLNSVSIDAEQDVCSKGSPLDGQDASGSAMGTQTECECEETSEPCVPDGGMD